ncbi:hypothetical protein NHH03_12090 [Stieleria sp. TO1_6]|uniref:hypothetical protein n=1 Tax=Stieleria tagensis TaxID=2956795 RepID=UPI00209B9212|nr:hypothetical protein [Stieleria tagensis]MCO8122479.1 hypothetical protein [Stieleria tagensis]
MPQRFPFIAVILLAGLATSLTAHLWAQTESPETLPPPSAESSDSETVPGAALLTERGRQLAQELRMLKRSRANLGSKHPTLPLITKKIEAIEEQLEAWEPAMGEPAENPFHAENPKPQINDYDLRQMVIQLNKRVEQLEKRISVLENK